LVQITIISLKKNLILLFLSTTQHQME